MRYRLQQRLFSFRDRYAIQNDLGEDVAYMLGEWLAISSRLTFMDVLGKELAYIKEVPFSMPGTFEIYRDGFLAAVMYRETIWNASARFTIDVPGTDDFTAEGDFSGHEYFIVRHGKAVAQISRQWFAMGDTYGVEMLADQDAVLILAASAVIDIALHHRRS